MKSKAYTVRLNLDVAAENNLYNLLKDDSKNYRSEAECIKSRLIEYYSNENEDIEDILLRTQQALMENMYDICLKIISSVGGLNIKTDEVKRIEESILPDASDKFPDGLSDVLDFLVS